ncbi:hypothetical protein ACFJIX_15035 [Roseateles sp. UC29_93]|uniref:hypothetical protein n=1 Tax=Roseateles sp. UC29_93 TaxID=3350177 RepID=UPI00367359D9
MDHAAIDPTQFIHIRMVLSMVVSLSIARLLSGLAKFVQHPGRLEVDGVHLLWALYMLVTLIHFWWWEFALSRIGPWHFLQFAFVVGYSAVLYLLCAILFPDDIAEYGGYRGLLPVAKTLVLRDPRVHAAAGRGGQCAQGRGAPAGTGHGLRREDGGGHRAVRRRGAGHQPALPMGAGAGRAGGAAVVDPAALQRAVVSVRP